MTWTEIQESWVQILPLPWTSHWLRCLSFSLVKWQYQHLLTSWCCYEAKYTFINVSETLLCYGDGGYITAYTKTILNPGLSAVGQAHLHFVSLLLATPSPVPRQYNSIEAAESWLLVPSATPLVGWSPCWRGPESGLPIYSLPLSHLPWLSGGAVPSFHVGGVRGICGRSLLYVDRGSSQVWCCLLIKALCGSAVTKQELGKGIGSLKSMAELL